MTNGANECDLVTLTGVLCVDPDTKARLISLPGAARAFALQSLDGKGLIKWIDRLSSSWKHALAVGFLVRTTGTQEETRRDLQGRLRHILPEDSHIELRSLGIENPDGRGTWYLVKAHSALGIEDLTPSGVHLAFEINSNKSGTDRVITLAEPRFLVGGIVGSTGQVLNTQELFLSKIGIEGFLPGKRPVRFAIFDSGIRPTGDLKNFIPKLPCGKLEGYSAFTGISPWEAGHGDTVARVIARVLSSVRQGSFSIVSYRVLSLQSCGTADAIACALKHAASHNIDIVCASWLLRGSAQVVIDALRGAASNIMLITGVPNDVVDVDKCETAQVLAHEDLKNVIVTGSIGPQDDWRGAYGDETIDIAAPGHGISADGNMYDSGTSYAAAVAAAIYGLGLTKHPDGSSAVSFRTAYESKLRSVKEWKSRCRTGGSPVL